MDILQLSMFDGKVCTKCKEWRNFADFGKNRAKKDGHQNYCYSCRSIAKVPLKSDANRTRFRAVQADHLTDGKVCPGCLKWKQKTAFNKRQSNGKYLHAYCINCNRIKKQLRREQNPKKVNTTRRAYYHRNHDHILRKQNDSYKADPEKFRKRGSEFYKRNSGKVKAWSDRWRRGNPNKVRAVWHRRRARQKAIGGAYAAAQWQQLCDWFGNICLACGLPKDLTVDHVIPLDPGPNTIDNLQPLCRSCNSSKRRKTIDYRDPDRLVAFLEHIQC